MLVSLSSPEINSVSFLFYNSSHWVASLNFLSLPHPLINFSSCWWCDVSQESFFFFLLSMSLRLQLWNLVVKGSPKATAVLQSGEKPVQTGGKCKSFQEGGLQTKKNHSTDAVPNGPACTWCGYRVLLQSSGKMQYWWVQEKMKWV